MDSLPEELIRLLRWLLWRYEDRGGPKPTKVPYQARQRLCKASSNDSRTWTSYDTAVEMRRYHGTRIDGIGFVFCDSDPYCGIDLDNVWRSDADEGAPWAMRILERFADTYSEESPSGCGVKIWCRAKAPRCGSWPVEAGAIEIYDHSRFFTVTGRSNGMLTVADHQEDIDQLIANLDVDDDHQHQRALRIEATIPYGTQHNTLVSLAGTMRRRGMSPEAIEAALLVVNQTQCERPGPEGNIRRIARSTERWER